MSEGKMEGFDSIPKEPEQPQSGRPEMTQEQAFLQAVIEKPDNDTPRLIFADWLEDYGDAEQSAWAAYIRVQCELAKLQLTQDDPRRLALEKQEGKLFKQIHKIRERFEESIVSKEGGSLN